ncbi:MAG: amino acid adenylation domain-containing protein, partial [Gemmatimonadaceae bacterium]
EQVERTPHTTAVICGDTALSYRELNERANQLAHELGKLGVCAGSRVGLYVERSVDTMVSLLAIIKSGGGYVPLDTALPAERLAYIVADSGVMVLIASRELITELPPCGATIVDLDGADWKANSRRNPCVAVSVEELAYIIYTSGSTGTPKGVQVPRRALVNLLWSMREKFQLGAMDRVLAITTISFDIAGVDIWLPWLVGATTVVASRAEAASGEELRALIDRHDITFLQATPATWWLLFAAGWQGKQDFQCASSGEAIPKELAARLAVSVGRFWNLYGPTETTIWSTGMIVTDPVERVSIGRPLGNSQCYVLDQRLEPQPIGVMGELYIAGDGLAVGYQSQPELTRELFVPNPFAVVPGARMYRSGDLARYLAGGNIEWLGRTDGQVKIRGFRIELGEIESVLERHERVRQAVVVLRGGAAGDQRLVAYVVADGVMPSTSELRKHLKQSLPEYMIPVAYVSMDALPLTPNGKIDRQALPAPNVSAPEPGVGRRTPDSPAQAELAQIWQELLRLPSVDVTADFFELGGHSLLAAAMMERIAASFGRRPPLSVLFEEPTIRHLSEWLISDGGFVEPLAVCINEGAPGRVPLFLFHGDYMGGGLYSRKLLRHLDPALPVYVLAPHLPGGPETIEGMAADMLPHIRGVQPHGPYLMLGYCNGGVVALEVASRLIAEGEPVDFLGIIDVDARNAQLGPLFKVVSWLTALRGFGQRRQLDTFIKLREPALRFLADDLPEIGRSSSFAGRAKFGTALGWLLVRRVARRGWRAVSRVITSHPPGGAELPKSVESLSPEDRTRIERNHYVYRAMSTYIPRQYNGCVTLITSSERQIYATPRALREWRAVAAQVNVITIPGDHTGIVTSGIAELGAALAAQISAAHMSGTTTSREA